MALFLCAVCSCIFIAAQAWMPLCFEEWQSVTHGGGQETFINQPNEDQQATWLDFPSRSTLVFIICPYFKDIELYIRNQLKSTEVYDSHCILRIQVISLYLPPLNILAHQKWTHFNKTVAFEPKFWCFGTSWDVRLPKRPHPQSLSGLCLDLSG